jgi:hypothetical protein
MFVKSVITIRYVRSMCINTAKTKKFSGIKNTLAYNKFYHICREGQTGYLKLK